MNKITKKKQISLYSTEKTPDREKYSWYANFLVTDTNAHLKEKDKYVDKSTKNK